MGFFGLFYFYKVRSLIPTCGGIIVFILLSSLGQCSNNENHHTYMDLQLKNYNPVESLLIPAGVYADDIGLGLLLGGIPPECGSGEVVGDLLVVVDGDLGVLAVLAELGLEPPCMVSTGIAQVGLDIEEKFATLESLGAVLGDGDLVVRVEAGGELGCPGGEVETEGVRDVVLHHGP